MGRGSPYVGFIPWLVFAVILRDGGEVAQWAALGGLVTALLIAGLSFRAHSLKILEVGAVAAFAGLTVAGFLLGPAHSEVLGRYGRAIATATLAIIAFGSLAIMPFTEQYARETTPSELWLTPTFKRTNQLFTTIWGFAFLAMATSHAIAGVIDTRRANTFLNWLVPIGIIVAVIKYMTAYRARLAEVGPINHGTS